MRVTSPLQGVSLLVSVKLELPRNKDLGENYEVKYVRIYGKPLYESAERIKNHFKNNGFKIVNQPRQIKHKETELRDGSWEMKIAIPKINGTAKDLPCYQLYQFGDKLQHKTTIQIWYPGSEIWCRKCLRNISNCQFVTSAQPVAEHLTIMECEESVKVPYLNIALCSLCGSHH